MLRFGRNKKKQTDTLVLYGSETGNAREVAQMTNKFLQKNGLKTNCLDMKKYRPEDLHQVQNLLVVVSTHGQGEPPPSAGDFFKRISSEDVPALPHLRFSVCALGDSAYQLFCAAGRNMDKRLKELDAKAFFPLTECDTDFSATAIEWIRGCTAQLKEIQA